MWTYFPKMILIYYMYVRTYILTLQAEVETLIVHEIENLLPSATNSVLQDVGNLPNNSRDTGIQKFMILHIIIN